MRGFRRFWDADNGVQNRPWGNAWGNTRSVRGRFGPLPKLDTIVQLAGAVDAEPCDLLAGLAWDLDRSGLWGPETLGNLEVKIGQRWEEA